MYKPYDIFNATSINLKSTYPERLFYFFPKGGIHVEHFLVEVKRTEPSYMTKTSVNINNIIMAFDQMYVES